MSERQLETMRRVYKYRAYPSKRQAAALECQLAFCCDLYNGVLQLRRDMWRECRISVNHLQVSKQLTELIRDCPELIPEGMSRSMLQKTIERNNQAFLSLFRRVKRGETPGFPRFKSRRRYDTIASQYGRGVELLEVSDESVSGNGAKARYLYWRGVGAIKIKFHRPLPVTARITEAQLKRQVDGWHRIRRDHQHKLARRLVCEADSIYIEDLNVKGLADSYLAKDVRDQGWSQFRAIIADKAAEAGRLLILVDPKGSSQECSGCGLLVKKPLGERIHACTCGLVLNRDVNAARVVLRRGERQREAVIAVRPQASIITKREVGRSLRAA